MDGQKKITPSRMIIFLQMCNRSHLFLNHMYQIVKFTFPFVNDFNKAKPCPTLVVSPSFGRHNQLIVSYITTNIEDKLETDLLIDPKESDFHLTGLRSVSLIKLHRLITVTPSQLGIIGTLPDRYIPEVKAKLMKVFQLK